jgi:transposase, IS5 family
MPKPSSSSAPTGLKKLRTYLGRVIRDIGRKIEGDSGLEAAFARLLWRVRERQQRQCGPKVYSLHAPGIECIGKGKAHQPYEFGVKVSVATTIGHAKGGQFVTHVKALPGNPYDGHTLETVIPDMEALVGSTIARILADKGYGGHNAPPDYECRVFLSGQKRGMTPAIKRELRHRSPAPWLVLTLYERTPYRRFQAFFDRMRSAMMPSWISVVPA